MTYKNAIKLHNEDEVTIKKTKEIRRVVEVIIIPKEDTANNIGGISVMLDDGNWYGYKEIK